MTEESNGDGSTDGPDGDGSAGEDDAGSVPDPPFGFAWGETTDVTWLRTDDGDYKRVEPAFLEVLEDLAAGERPVDDLDPAAIAAVETLHEEGYLEPGGAVRRVETPESIALWPRVLAFGLVMALLTAFVGRQLLDPVGAAATPGDVDLVRQLTAAGVLFLGLAIVHELGHYAVARRYFDPTIRPALHSGFVPSLVTHTTGAWACPPSVRIWISLAGPFADAVATLVLAVGALTVLPAAGLVAAFVVFEYVRILFALNPLLRGDGYWIVVDGLGLTNLHTRGKRDLRRLRPSWPAAYVIASSAFSVALLAVMAVILGSYVGVL